MATRGERLSGFRGNGWMDGVPWYLWMDRNRIILSKQGSMGIGTGSAPPSRDKLNPTGRVLSQCNFPWG